MVVTHCSICLISLMLRTASSFQLWPVAKNWSAQVYHLIGPNIVSIITIHTYSNSGNPITWSPHTPTVGVTWSPHTHQQWGSHDPHTLQQWGSHDPTHSNSGGHMIPVQWEDTALYSPYPPHLVTITAISLPAYPTFPQPPCTPLWGCGQGHTADRGQRSINQLLVLSDPAVLVSVGSGIFSRWS